ncbi:MAG: hypothetical protein K8S97_04235 [Anaerolineae bacterium]|nr:hypothetical protein [Anaerolineae bacterium]
MALLDNYMPRVNRRWLFLTAGLLWGIAGIILWRRAVKWLAAEDTGLALLLLATGLLSGVLIARFKFRQLVLKNIERIHALPERGNLFAFQSARSYVLIVFMMSLGIALRHSAFPKSPLAVLYIGIGTGLLLASLPYYQHV